MQLILLKGGGRVIYSGSLGQNSCHVINYFEVSLLDLHIWIPNYSYIFFNSIPWKNRAFLVFRRSEITTVQQHGCLILLPHHLKMNSKLILLKFTRTPHCMSKFISCLDCKESKFIYGVSKFINHMKKNFYLVLKSKLMVLKFSFFSCIYITGSTENW